MLTCRAAEGAVAAADVLAASAGARQLAGGGNAVDAALAAAAVMAVVGPHMCGVGGDMFALVKSRDAPPVALNGSGRAGSGADPERLRAAGFTEMPFHHHVSSVTVPGCVAGWAALHERFGSFALEQVFADACRLARSGFPVSPTLAKAALDLAPGERQSAFGTTYPLRPGRRLAVPRLATILENIARRGASGFYEGPAGAALIEIGAGEFAQDDLAAARADWLKPLGVTAFGHDLWTVPPNSQGYLVLASAWIAERLALPEDPNSGEWAFLLAESARQAAFDRVRVLHEHAQGTALVDRSRLAPRAAAVGTTAIRGLADFYGDGATTYICAVDRDRTAVSLIMSNAADFGSRLTLPGHGVFLHNRGIGFSLEPDHPAEYGPSRRPPHTLSPLLVTAPSGELTAVLGTMGADAQPQILLQLLVRTFKLGVTPAEAVIAPRWIFSRTETTGFDVWRRPGPPLVRLEHGSPTGWKAGLRGRGYKTAQGAPGDQSFGHAHLIRVAQDGVLHGIADPRAGIGGCVGA